MGPLGTEGIFTDAAEHTLNNLKKNSSSLLTILSAIACDPLYSWSLSPVKARKIQQDDTSNAGLSTVGNRKENSNDAAARAIAKVQEKLQGYEDGTSGEQQSVEGQIQWLVNVARDHDNLCALFPGWTPWV